MRHSLTLRARTKFTISSILGVFLVVLCFFTSSCTADKKQISDAEFGFTAEAVPEGILLSFKNIPSDAIRMFINISYLENNENPSIYNLISSHADIRDTSSLYGANPSFQMEKIKQTGKIIFPFVKTGQSCHISVYIYNIQDFELSRNDINFIPIIASTDCIAENGIYINKDNVVLDLNKTKTSATLLSEPVFSADVNFAANKFDFSVTIIVEGKGSISISTHHLPGSLSSDGLTWVFEPQMSENIKVFNSAWLENGNKCPAWVTAKANVIYDDIIWSVEIAKTQEFNYSL